MTAPIVTLAEFLGPHVIGHDAGHTFHRTRQLREPGIVLATMCPHGDPPGKCPDPYILATCSEPGAVVATLASHVVGGHTHNSIWVDPLHRKRGLSIELVVQRWLLIGWDEWKRVRPRKSVYTRAGYHARVAAYLVLVSRGLIVAPNANGPNLG